MISLTVNGKDYKVDVPKDISLLWVLRDYLGLTGTKFSCGIGECGSCTVLIEGEAQRSCQISAEDAQGASITTIEGLPGSHRSDDSGLGNAFGIPAAQCLAREIDFWLKSQRLVFHNARQQGYDYAGCIRDGSGNPYGPGNGRRR